jgi:hypothetical protein
MELPNMKLLHYGKFLDENSTIEGTVLQFYIEVMETRSQPGKIKTTNSNLGSLPLSTLSRGPQFSRRSSPVNAFWNFLDLKLSN